MNEIHQNARHYGRMDLNLLKVFEAVYREQHLGRAAQSLFLTGSAVSHALRRLRAQFNDSLFERDGRRMVPTPLCERLAPELLEALAGLQSVLQQAGSFTPATSRQHFYIGLHDAMESLVLPGLMHVLRHRAPGITISSVRVERVDMVRELGSGRLHLAIDIAQPVAGAIHHLRLFDDPLCVVLRDGHPMLDSPDLGHYLAAGHVVVSNRRSGRVGEDFALQRFGHERRIVLRCQNYQAASRIVADSDLVLTMPRSLAMQVNQSLGNRIIDLPLALPGLELDMYWHERVDRDPANQWLRSHMQRLAGVQSA